MYIHMLLAFFWLSLGLALVIYHWLRPEEQFLRLRGTDISPGWLAIALAVYNLFRWWMGRTGDRERELQEQLARQRARHDSPDPHAQPPDPNFDFSREAARPDGDDTKPS